MLFDEVRLPQGHNILYTCGEHASVKPTVNWGIVARVVQRH
jgi:hypothetical protein